MRFLKMISLSFPGVVPSLKTPVKSDPEKGPNSEKADFERAIELTGNVT